VFEKEENNYVSFGSVKKKKENNSEEKMSNAKLTKIAYLRPHLLVVAQKQ
jgi:hypothetical protein